MSTVPTPFLAKAEEEGFGPRILEFAQAFASRFCPALSHEDVFRASKEILDQLRTSSQDKVPAAAAQLAESAGPPAAAPSEVKPPVPEPGSSVGAPSTSPGFLQLSFRHTCLALGCKDSECTLCQYNPVRLCSRNFGKKYLVGDVLRASCGAPIKVDIKNLGGQRHEADLQGVSFEVSLLDGVLYKEKGGEVRQVPLEDLRACIKFTNHRDEALLQLKSGMSGSNRRIIVKAERGTLQLPELQVTDSSEALLTGRKPPFRLAVVAVGEDGAPLPSNWGYCVSEEFVVATRRVKQANKAEIPLMDDHVSKIEHIGRETVKKLTDMRGAAAEIGMVLGLPDRLTCVSSVGQFVKLVEMAEKDAQLKKVLQVVLKLSKEKWEEAAAHALTAVVSDFRRRVWYPPGHGMAIGVLFSCKYGAVQLKDPVALLQQVPAPGSSGANGSAAGTAPCHRICREDELDPSSLTHLRQLKQQAVNCWWSPGHPGWGIFKEPGEAPGAGIGGIGQDLLSSKDQASHLAAGMSMHPGAPASPLEAAGNPTLTITALNTALQQHGSNLAAAAAAAAAAGGSTIPGLPATSLPPLAPLHISNGLQLQQLLQLQSANAGKGANPAAAMAALAGLRNGSLSLEMLLQQAQQQGGQDSSAAAAAGSSSPALRRDSKDADTAGATASQRSSPSKAAGVSSPGNPNSSGSSPLQRGAGSGEMDVDGTTEVMPGAKRRRSNSGSGSGLQQNPASRAASLSLSLDALAAVGANGGSAFKEWVQLATAGQPGAATAESGQSGSPKLSGSSVANGNGTNLAIALPTGGVLYLPGAGAGSTPTACSGATLQQQLAALLTGQAQAAQQQVQNAQAAAAAQQAAGSASNLLEQWARNQAQAAGLLNLLGGLNGSAASALGGLMGASDAAAAFSTEQQAQGSAALAALGGLMGLPSIAGAGGLGSLAGSLGAGAAGLSPAQLSQLACLSQLAASGKSMG